MLRFLAALPLVVIAAAPVQAEQQKQLVVISFDGAHDNALWTRSRDMAKRTGAHFTYFLSCTFLMTKADGKAYKAPHHGAGRSNVGFAPDTADVAARLDNIWQAHLEGHDIGSHACGHFDGGSWTTSEWEQELESFKSALTDAWKNNGLSDREPEGWADLAKTGIAGFRAPYLSAGDGLLPALKASGYLYDASSVSKGPILPALKDGMMRFSLPLIAEGPSNRPVIGMDYNLFVRHSMGVENKKDSAAFEERTYQAFKAAFEAQHEGDRVPLELGFHFVEMNGGAYWRALDRLLTEVCHQPDVACVSHAEAMTILKKKKAENSAF
ncbi:polysaccharide deacetylase [Pararhizobium sp.]|uniref:polysaccharide deacetylase n=1 Tax=Pararhizobium sp. TaxID=1977563 RepID=UPI00271ED5BB|nr:polysaccharide deacetylase [Pararhizobium sp.]MDO9414888.1 polysaccharide deacetylase [Pararhizobium sp.]